MQGYQDALEEPGYLNAQMQVLEHFKTPELFIRNTKKCFISVVDQETLETGRSAKSVEYQGVRSELRRRNLPFKMAYCRKIFATFMRKRIDVELVDLLQGRVPTSVFARYYNKPDYITELDKVRCYLPELRELFNRTKQPDKSLRGANRPSIERPMLSFSG